MLLPLNMLILKIFHPFPLYSKPKLTLDALFLSPICDQTHHEAAGTIPWWSGG